MFYKIFLIFSFCAAVSTQADEPKLVEANPPSRAKEKVIHPALTPKEAKEPSRASNDRDIPRILRQIESKYHRAGTLVADFKQVKKVKSTETEKESSGTIMLKRPDQVRWETQKPSQNILVSNGKTFWFYTPPFDETEKGQVIIRETSKFQSKLASALLAGAFSTLNGVKIRRERLDRYELSWDKGLAGNVKTVDLDVDFRKKLITSVKLIHYGGNESYITLDNIRLGEKLAENQFNFDIPAGAEIIKESGFSKPKTKKKKASKLTIKQ